MSESATTTRYEQVKEILDLAANGGVSDYDGKGLFWHLPLAQLLQVEIHGVRMIAPPPPAVTASCCHAGTTDGTGSTGRGESSGLIRGLRGLPPFDGSHFPALPWGGQAVAPTDIRFISEWIDDGCPPDDRQISFPTTVTITKPTLEKIDENNVETAARTFGVYEGSPNEYRYKYGELKQRMNVDFLPASEVEKLRWAFRELYRFNKWSEDRRSYNNMALIHQNHCQHGWERFLPWHRVYLYEFEQALQDVCPDITMPYWDWTMPHYCPERPQQGSIIPLSYKAFLTRDSIKYLVEQADPQLPAEAGETLLKKIVEPNLSYTSQTTFFDDVAKFIDPEFTKDKHRERFIDALLAANSLWYPLRYSGEYFDPKTKQPLPINQSIFHYHYPTAEDMKQVLGLRTFRDFGGGSFYDDSFGFLDQNPHNTMHIWTGGQNPNPAPTSPDSASDTESNRNRTVKVAGRKFHSRDDLYSRPIFGDMLSNLTASYDPIFWPIHANIDRVWSEWQQINPHSLPRDLDAVLTPWSYTINDTLDMSRFGYEYVKCAYLLPVGLQAPVGRFVSQPINVPDTLAGNFKQAEVRLHRVPQLPRSCFIRVFLNLADANASTSIDDSHYAGYLAIFGHADCIGGPGHCDLPPDRTRKYDQRPRHHNTPRNHRINVTSTAKRLLDNGASSLQITLVVIGADYCEDTDLLRLEGVSLDFLD